jgi:hypothetical protein
VKLSSTIIGLLTGAIAVLTAAKTVIEIGSGKQFGLQQIAFYAGASAIAVYLAAGAGLMLFAALGGGLVWLNGGKDISKSITYGLLAIGSLAGLVVAVLVILAGVLFNYENTDAFGRAAVALIGLTAVAGGVYLYSRNKPTTDK